MKFSEGSLLRQYERAFRAYGSRSASRTKALRLLAQAAATEKTGARGLLTCLRNCFEITNSIWPARADPVACERDARAGAATRLNKLMVKDTSSRRKCSKPVRGEFAEKFSKEHALEIVSTRARSVAWSNARKPSG